MSRILRFRAWDESKKVMKLPVGLTEDGVGKWVKHSCACCGTTYEYYGIVMQYIGIKDKNNKDIYEGDIIKNITYNSCNGNKEEHVYVCKYENNYFCYSHGYDCEVIGNIFENPDLAPKQEEDEDGYF